MGSPNTIGQGGLLRPRDYLEAEETNHVRCEETTASNIGETSTNSPKRRLAVPSTSTLEGWEGLDPASYTGSPCSCSSTRSRCYRSVASMSPAETKQQGRYGCNGDTACVHAYSVMCATRLGGCHGLSLEAWCMRAKVEVKRHREPALG